MKINQNSPFLVTKRANINDSEKEVIVAANEQGNAFVFLADPKQASTLAPGRKLSPSSDTKAIASDGSLTAVEFSKRVGMGWGGIKVAQGVIVGRDALAAMNASELSTALQSSPTVGISPELAERTANFLKGADSLVIARYATSWVALTAALFGIGKAWWPEEPWWKVLLIAAGLAIVLVLVFWLGVNYGIFQPDTPSKP